jgi:nucleoside-diphosphate-sugar epimerase
VEQRLSEAEIGESKLTTEQYTRVYNEIYGLPTVALRYFTVYGPRMRPNMAMTNFVSRCLHGEPPVIDGDGTQTRDFTYIDDIKRVNAQLLTDDSTDGEILNVGSTDTIDIKTLAEVVRARSIRRSSSSSATHGKATTNTPTPISRRRTNYWATSRRPTAARASDSSSTGTATIRRGTTRSSASRSCK